MSGGFLMKIAISGANGFIGKSLIDTIQRHSPDVEIIAIVRNVNTMGFSFGEAVNVVSMDVYNSPNDVFIEIGSPDTLIHLAWDGLPNYNSLHHIESELPNQYAFLNRLVKSGLKSLVVTGTCFEYGMQSGELNEGMAATPSNPYGFAKNALREQLEYLQGHFFFNLTWCRLFYIHGDNQSGNSIYPQLIKAIDNGDAIFNMSKGEQLRDYLDVNEVVEKLLKLTLLENNIGVVNVCSGTPISIRSLVEKWVAHHSVDIELNLGHYPYPTYEPLAFWGSTKKLQTVLETVNDGK